MKALNSTAFLKNWHWPALLGLFVTVRLTLLFFSPHFIYRSEELYQGYLGAEFLSGLKSSFWDYQIDPYSGGSLIVGVLAAVSFKFFGESLFALKLVPFLFSFLTLITVMGFLQRFFGKRAAVWGGLLGIFPAPALASLSVSALGSHPESRLFAAGIIWSFYEVLFSGRTNKISWLLLGTLSSIALWFSGINITIILTCVITWMLIPNKVSFLKTGLLWLFLGGILGALPWLWFNITHAFKALTLFKETFFEQSSMDLKQFLLLYPLEIGRLMTIEIPASFSVFYAHPVVNKLFSIAYMWIALALLIRVYQLVLPSFIQEESGPEPYQNRHRFVFFAVFPVVFLLVMAFISLRVSWHGEMLPYRFRYFALFYLYFYVLGGILASQNRKFLSWAVLPMLIMGIAGYLIILKPENTGKLLRVPGYSIESTQRIWSTHALPAYAWRNKSWDELAANKSLFLKIIHDPAFWGTLDLNALKDKIQALPPMRKYFFIHTAGSRAAEAAEPDNIKTPAWLTPADIDLYYYGFADGLNWDRIIETPETLNAYFLGFPKDLQHWFLFRLGKHGFHWDLKQYKLEPSSDTIPAFAERLSTAEKQWFYRGIGSGFLRHFPNMHPLVMKRNLIFSNFPTDEQNNFLWGLGWNLRGRRARHDEKWLEKQIKEISESDKNFIWKGFNDYEEKWYKK